MSYSYYLEIAGIRLLWEADFRLTFHHYLAPFTVEKADPEITYFLRAENAPPVTGALQYESARMRVYGVGNEEQRVYPMWESDAENPALIPQGGNCFTLYLPPEHQGVYEAECEFTPMLALERLFAERDRLILHSSVVIYKGQAVLFCAPSGVGKSTQAGLWERHLGAEILNGDRCVIEQRGTEFIAHGSPYSGSSEINKRKSAPIRGIFLLSQAKENRIEKISPAQAVRTLFSQTVVNLWNPTFAERVTDLLSALASGIPICSLACLPEISAVELAKDTLFGTGYRV